MSIIDNAQKPPLMPSNEGREGKHKGECILFLKTPYNAVKKENVIIKRVKRQPFFENQEVKMIKIDNIRDLAEKNRLFEIEFINIITPFGNPIDVHERTKDGETLLHIAVNQGWLDASKTSIEIGCDVNAKNQNGGTPLHYAIAIRNKAIAKLLIDNGANVNVADDYKWTPLHIASFFGYLEIVKLLLKAGADVNVMDGEGWSPLYLATKRGHFEVANLLLAKMRRQYCTRKRDRGHCKVCSLTNYGKDCINNPIEITRRG